MGSVRAATGVAPSTGDDVWTNLTAAEMEDVLKAIDERRVTWDNSKRILEAGHCEGEFDYAGQRYRLIEDHEVLKSLCRL